MGKGRGREAPACRELHTVDTDRLYAQAVWRSLFRVARMERIDRRPPEEGQVATVRPLLFGLRCPSPRSPPRTALIGIVRGGPLTTPVTFRLRGNRDPDARGEVWGY